MVGQLGTAQWAMVAQNMGGRNGKQCRERWHNQLDRNLTVRPATGTAGDPRASLGPLAAR